MAPSGYGERLEMEENDLSHYHRSEEQSMIEAQSQGNKRIKGSNFPPLFNEQNKQKGAEIIEIEDEEQEDGDVAMEDNGSKGKSITAGSSSLFFSAPLPG